MRPTSARRTLRGALAFGGLLLAGCGQLQLRGAPDPCPAQRSLAEGDIQSCWRDQAAILTDHPVADPSQHGVLRGAPLSLSAGRPMRHVIALDYSGSMYGGYGKDEPGAGPGCGWRPKPDGTGKIVRYHWEAPGFAELLRDGMLSGARPGDRIYPMVFNRDVYLLGDQPGEPIPFDAAAGRFATLPEPVLDSAAALRRLTPAPSGTLPANPFARGLGRDGMALQSRLPQALDAAAALFEASTDRDGVLWIVTDNIIEKAPPGDTSGTIQRDASYNREFYDRLKSDPRWQVVYAWPLHRSSWLCGGTLMVYGLYYSSRERFDERGYADLCLRDSARLGRREQIETFARYASEKSPSPGGTFKLKPVDMDVVRLSFVGWVKCPPRRVGETRPCKAEILIENLLHHRQVDAARIVLENGRTDPHGRSGNQPARVRTASPFCAGTIHEEILLPGPIPPRGSLKVPVILKQVPAVRTETRTLRDYWENAQFERFQMVGSMKVAIRDLQTSMAVHEDDLEGIYGVKELPRIFRNPGTDNLDAAICLVMAVDNPSYLASLLFVLLAFLIVGTIAAGGWLSRPVYRMVQVDGEERGQIRLTRLAWATVLVDGLEVARARLRLGGMPRLRGANGHKVVARGSGWDYQSGDGFGVPRRIALVPRGRANRRTNSEF